MVGVGGIFFGAGGPGRPPVSLGVKLILLYHTLENLLFIVLAIGDLIIFQSPTLRLTSKYSSRLAVAGYSAVGLPIIFVALWAVYNRKEVPMRCYFYYMLLSILVNAAYTVDALVHFLPCATTKLHDAAALKIEPNIFQCGHPRALTLVTLIFVVGFQLSMLYPVHTFCEDLKWDSEDPEQRVKQGLSRLPSRRLAIAAQWAMLRDGPLNHIHGRMPGEYGSMYETANAIGNTQSIAYNSQKQIPYLPSARLV